MKLTPRVVPGGGFAKTALVGGGGVGMDDPAANLGNGEVVSEVVIADKGAKELVTVPGESGDA